MANALKITKNTEESVREFLKILLEKRKVKGVFTLKKIGKNGAVTYSLITKSDELNDAVPFYPLMPTNAGKLLSRITRNGSTTEPVAVIVKPCELRAFIELVKREQGHFENLYIISSTCGGVYPLKTATDGTIEKNLSDYWDAVKKGEINQDLRPACTACTEFTPYGADITVDLIGNTELEKKCFLLLNTKKGEELVQDMKGELVDRDFDKEKLKKFYAKREKAKNQFFNENTKINGLDDLIKIFGRCIGCHGCSKVCPICYCTLCMFDSSNLEYKPSKYESEVRQRGGLKIPPGTIYYHLGRLTHVGISCVGCGSCEDVCPVNIPLTLIFKKVGESMQQIFEYIPGKNITEKIPLVTYNEEEYTEIEG
ncbi:coenzyme F420 hydrogenase [Thermoplasmatales archaeon SM1-50]|nr:MAG: coenzyme F420 hydrogenase [Thermoplasmatales archaeon SM1-50]